MVKHLSILCFVLLLFACDKEDTLAPAPPYFPDISNDNWENVNLQDIGWNPSNVAALTQWIQSSKTRAVVVLKGGKIAIEEYAGTNLIGGNFDRDKIWYWASAGKSLTSSVVGIAASRGQLNLDDRTSNYLGPGWTSLSPQEEDQIKIKHQISMTSGLDDKKGDCLSPSCLQYLATPGERWAYHNPPYTLLDQVITAATKTVFSEYFQDNLGAKIGMSGIWRNVDENNVYFSTALDMARYGLLVLRNGRWNNVEVIPADYLSSATNSSQNLNFSYGYLWWLNGKSSYMLPTVQRVFDGPLLPDAPSDMYMALGKNGQILMIIPSIDLVVVRMGDAPDALYIGLDTAQELWALIDKIIKP